MATPQRSSSFPRMLPLSMALLTTLVSSAMASAAESLPSTTSSATATASASREHSIEGWDALIPNEPSVTNAHLFYLLLGAFVCLFGVFSLVIKDKFYMSEAMVATAFGIAIGPLGLRFFNPQESFSGSLGDVTLEVSRVVIAIQVMACGIDLPGNYIWREGWSMFMLIVPNMIIKWIISGLGVYWIIGTPFLTSLVIAACLTPTDPVLANSIVKGKFAERHIPENVRLILSAESGMNDGLGTPFLYLALYLMRRTSAGVAIGDWLLRVVLYQIVVAVIVGVLMALAAQYILKYAVKREWIDKESLLAFSIALALLIDGVVAMFGGDDILAVFIAGNVLSWDLWFNERMKGSHFQEVIDYLLNLAYFIYIGAVLPWGAFGTHVGWLKLVLITLWMMCIRRIPVVMGLSPWIPALRNWKEAFFAAWFGPMGASAIFYALLAVVYLDVDEHPVLEIVMFVVLSSIVLHGGSVPIFNAFLTLQQKRAGGTPTTSDGVSSDSEDGFDGVKTLERNDTHATAVVNIGDTVADAVDAPSPKPAPVSAPRRGFLSRPPRPDTPSSSLQGDADDVQPDPERPHTYASRTTGKPRSAVPTWAHGWVAGLGRKRTASKRPETEGGGETEMAAVEPVPPPTTTTDGFLVASEEGRKSSGSSTVGRKA
ncbi:hypothetical protein HDU96_001690 [Phlyctochytrium bullatum]|nr:hypothetical protein HDU96_001690 [Phlyctochytrium bullatum]